MQYSKPNKDVPEVQINEDTQQVDVDEEDEEEDDDGVIVDDDDDDGVIVDDDDDHDDKGKVNSFCILN